MSSTWSHDPKSPVEPETESLRALVRWLGQAPESSLAFLAHACGVREQTLVAFVERRARPEPDSELAKLVAIATQGAVPSFGWSTDEEFEARCAARERAQQLALALHPARAPRSRRPASRPIAARRRRPSGSSTPRSSRPASSSARRSAAHTRDAPLEPPPITPLVDEDEEAPSTERSDPPTLPSSSIPSRPRPSTPRARAVAVVESGAPKARPGAERREDAGLPVAAEQGTSTVADAIETLTQQGYSIRLERKE